MCYTGLDQPKVSRTAIVRARKEHTCCECNESIRRGDDYHVVSGLWVDTFDAFKTCARCYFVREMLAREEIAEGCGYDEAYPPFTHLAEAWHEAHRGFPGDAPPEYPELKDVPRW